MATAPPQAASDFYAEQQRQKLATLILVQQLWSKLNPGGNWSQQAQTLAPLIGAVIGAQQERIARSAGTYIATTASQTGVTRSDNTATLAAAAGAQSVNPAGFGGWNGDGTPIETIVGWAIALAGQTYSQAKALTGKSNPETALAEGGRYLTRAVSTALADTARAASSTSMVAFYGGAYVRMLNPPSCSRCALLAGKRYQSNTGFLRHPECDCIHIPVAEAHAHDVEVNPNDYFDSLPTAAELVEQHPDLTVKMRREAGMYSQEDVFTVAGAKAIRDGADISQVVNARSGMKLAQDFTGQKVVYTLDGTTKRAWFGGGYAARKYGDTDWFNQFGYARREGTRRTEAMRLMPETIYHLASDQAEAVRLLKRYGFII